VTNLSRTDRRICDEWRSADPTLNWVENLLLAGVLGRDRISPAEATDEALEILAAEVDDVSWDR
jgi:hypothetical protein